MENRKVEAATDDERKTSFRAADASEPPATSRERNPQPVFQVSSYRTGSTWLWQKMRSLPNTIAYYEIFHDSLATLTVEQARRLSYANWLSRHPPMNAYFLEFVPLLAASGGVVEFDVAAVRDGFIPRGSDGDLSPAEKAYVDRLVSDAWSKRKVPYLSCTGSLGRAGALRKAFGGKVILLHRNLFHQWASYCSLADSGNTYFLSTILSSFEAGAHDPFLSNVSLLLDIADADVTRRDILFPAFIILHLYLYSISYDHADVVVAPTEIAFDRSVRQRAERDLSDLMGCELDLTDAREKSEFASAAFEAPPLLRETIEQLAKLIPGSSLSDKGALFVDRACQDALAEWERFEFYTRGMRTVLTGKIADAEARLGLESAKVSDVQADNDRLLDDVSAAVLDLRGEQAAPVQRADAVRQLVSEGRGIRDALRAVTAEKTASQHDLADARARIAAVAVERDAALARLAETAAERDAALARAAETAAERAVERHALGEEIAGSALVRDHLERALAEARRTVSLLERARKLTRRP